MIVRGKFVLNEIHAIHGTTAKRFVFFPTCDLDIPEDQRFSRYTPSGRLELQVDNPAVQWQLGCSYYLELKQVASVADTPKLASVGSDVAADDDDPAPHSSQA